MVVDKEALVAMLEAMRRKGGLAEVVIVLKGRNADPLVIAWSNDGVTAEQKKAKARLTLVNTLVII